MIPKKIHQIWLGDQKKRPQILINSWKYKNPDWDHFLWTEENIPEIVNKKQFDATNEYPGKADILRYELLYYFGGIFIDADSECVKPLNNLNINEYDLVCCYENEILCENLCSNGYLASKRKSKYIRDIIAKINNYTPSFLNQLPELSSWKYLGPVLLTEILNRRNYYDEKINILPSHIFIPKHHTGLEHYDDSEIYAKQYWGSTINNFGRSNSTY